MSEHSNRQALPSIGAILFVALVLYVVGYFALGRHTVVAEHHFRDFQSHTIGMAYLPLGWVECKIRQQSFCLEMPGRSEFEINMICFEP